MKFTLWGQIEGIRVVAESTLWVGTEHGTIVDLSQAARAAGIRTTFSLKAALALTSQLEVCEVQDEPTGVLQRVWQEIYHFTPWLETVHLNGFCAQISAPKTPFEEVRELMEQLAGLLPEDARLTLGLAQSPVQARALVEWHSWHVEHGGSLPSGVLVQFEAHTLLCDPLLLTPRGENTTLLSVAVSPQTGHPSDLAEEPSGSAAWLQQLPIGAAWFLPPTAKTALFQLGIHTYGELRRTPRQRLLRMFGKEAAVWVRWFEMTSTSIHCNYPPQSLEQSWQAPAGEAVYRDRFLELVSHLLPPIARKLERSGLGAGMIELRWQTETGWQSWQRKTKRQVATEDALRVLFTPAEVACEGKWIEQMTLVVSEIRSQRAVQAAILPQEGFVSLVDAPQNTLDRLCTRLEKRFPGRLALGLKPSFRELRWRAFADG
jgi:hypothetical protein